MRHQNEGFWAPRMLAIVRVVTALLFLEHGLMKLAGFPAPEAGVSYPLPPMLEAATWMEMVGAPLMLVGFATRPIAFLLSGEMAVAYWTAHAPQSLWPALNQGEPAILFCFIFLYLAFAGPGAWSVDAFVNERRVREGFVPTAAE